jgi:hypothetical protein
MIQSRVSVPATVTLLLLTSLAACTVGVKEPARVSARGHVEAGHDARTGQPAVAPGQTECPVYTGTDCYWMETDSGRYCWVPAEWADTLEGCYAMDSCDGGMGESNGGCYKWADGSLAERARWPNQ